MKNNTPSLMLLVTLFISCETAMKFESPQPENSKDEVRFKNKYQGTYLCTADSSILTIQENKIIREWHLLAQIKKSEVDSMENVSIRDNRLYDENGKEGMIIAVTGDLLTITFNYIDTLFTTNKEQLLRYYKGRYFLNYKKQDDLWTVKILSLDRSGLLTMQRIKGGETAITGVKNMTTVETVTDTVGEIVGYRINPTKKELKEILKTGFFSEQEKFRKIKL